MRIFSNLSIGQCLRFNLQDIQMRDKTKLAISPDSLESIREDWIHDEMSALGFKGQNCAATILSPTCRQWVMSDRIAISEVGPLTPNSDHKADISARPKSATRRHPCREHYTARRPQSLAPIQNSPEEFLVKQALKVLG
jgi:hypothetical protein